MGALPVPLHAMGYRGLFKGILSLLSNFCIVFVI